MPSVGNQLSSTHSSNKTVKTVIPFPLRRDLAKLGKADPDRDKRGCSACRHVRLNISAASFSRRHGYERCGGPRRASESAGPRRAQQRYICQPRQSRRCAGIGSCHYVKCGAARPMNLPAGHNRCYITVDGGGRRREARVTAGSLQFRDTDSLRPTRLRQDGRDRPTSDADLRLPPLGAGPNGIGRRD